MMDDMDFTEATAAVIADMARRDEDLIREMLSRWPLSAEPAVAYRDGKIIGLTLRDIPVGAIAPIVVAPK